MKVLVTGAKGQLGRDLVSLLSQNNFEVYGYGRDELDITNIDNVEQVFNEVKPDIVIHSAAHTKVDLAESEPDQAYLINGIGTRNISLFAEKVGAKLVYVSTDYVFDGTATKPINEFTPTNPQGIYGKSKLAGEHFVRDLHSRFFIVRTSWVYGEHGGNFVKTMLNLAQENKSLKVVADQVGCPTYTKDLAKTILEIMQTEKYGIYHVSNSGQCSWYEFAVAIFEEAGLQPDVSPCSTEEFPRPAPRPAYSVFDHMALRLNGFNEVRHWREALREFIENYKEMTN